MLDKWARRTHRTWMRHTWSGSGQLLLLWFVRSAVTATALWLWWQGRASAGEITYVLTAYFVVHGYLRARHSVARARQSFTRIVEALAALGRGEGVE